MQRGDEGRRLALRRERSELHAGLITDIAATNGVLRYLRTHESRHIQVLLNMTGEARTVECSAGHHPCSAA